MDVSIWAHDGNLQQIAPLDYTTFSATLYHNGVGSWLLTLPYSPATWAMAKDNDFGITVDWNGNFRFGGRRENPGFQSSVPGTAGGATTIAASGKFIVIAGADYLAPIANRIAFPDPAHTWSAQTSGASDSVSSVPLETAIKHYVSVNAGSAARAERQIPIMTIAPDGGRGGNVSYDAKFSAGVDLNLMDIIRGLAATGGPMGISMTDDGSGGLTFDVYVPRDLSGLAVFSEDLGNLVSFSVAIEDPVVTDAMVQGKTEFIHVSSSASSDWWRYTEQFVQQDSETSHNKIIQAGNDAIAQGAAGPQVAATTLDIPALTFGKDYYLGDKVSVEAAPGDVYSDIVSQVDLIADPQQQPAIQVIPTVGYPSDPGAADPHYARRLLREVRRIERRLDAQIG